MSRDLISNRLAKAILAGRPDAASVRARVQKVLQVRGSWTASLAQRYEAQFAGKIRPRLRDVLKFLRNDPGYLGARAKYGSQWSSASQVFAAISTNLSQPMQPHPAAAEWALPAIMSMGDLQRWLHLTPEELAWFANRHRQSRVKPPALEHYNYAVIAKRNGEMRLLEAPKQHLKLLQQTILRDILDRIPVHEAAHGFRKSRSIRSFAAPHAGKAVVLRMDIQNFFPSIRAPRVDAFFRTAGYPEAVAETLAALCTNVVPRSVWMDAMRGREPMALESAALLRADYEELYARRHLPQGASTSPALANLCAYRLDCRLNGLAKASGATYTRYADDLAFSGDRVFARGITQFADRVGAILLEEDFRAHYRKTRVMRAGARQSLAGLIVNKHPNIARSYFDELKAILTNCVCHGPETQNRENLAAWQSHLSGRINFVESIHPARGAKLRAIYRRIHW